MASNLKLEADERGVWISSSGGEFTQTDIYDLLKEYGIEKYETKAVGIFMRDKGVKPCLLAKRDPKYEREAKITVSVANDKTFASVKIDPPFFTKPWPTLEDVLGALADKSVTFGIDNKIIEDMLANKQGEKYIQVAKAKPPVEGKNARIELLRDPDKPMEVRADEKIDFWSMSSLVSLKPGDQIAVKHELIMGVDGNDVTGGVIRAGKVHDVDFGYGDGIGPSDADPLIYDAKIEGQLKRVGGKLVVLPELDINGDVDFGVGSVTDFHGSVRIKGAVRAGFHVSAEGNIDIRDIVEGAEVSSQGNVNINAGVRGMGKGIVKADKDVNIGFADQATIRSGGTIRVKNAILHSKLYANDSIIVLGSGQKSQIAGGRIECGGEVSCQVLGSEMGTKTEVFVGLPPEQMERRRVLAAEVEKCKDNLTKLEPNLAFLKKLAATGQLDEVKRPMMMNMTKMKFQLKAALESMTHELNDLDHRLDCVKNKGVVRVKGVCYPGVQISIRGLTYQVKEKCMYTTFAVDDGQVALKPYDFQMAGSPTAAAEADKK